jgi:hypothetical protein
LGGGTQAQSGEPSTETRAEIALQIGALAKEVRACRRVLNSWYQFQVNQGELLSKVLKAMAEQGEGKSGALASAVSDVLSESAKH